LETPVKSTPVKQKTDRFHPSTIVPTYGAGGVNSAVTREFHRAGRIYYENISRYNLSTYRDFGEFF
jgi:transcription-repair coupling factor (superfamily II helicase)